PHAQNTYFTTFRPPHTSTLFPYTTLFRSAFRSARRHCHKTPANPAIKTAITAANAAAKAGLRRTHLRPDSQALLGRAIIGSSRRDRKSTRLNSSHLGISYAVFCLKKKKRN